MVCMTNEAARILADLHFIGTNAQKYGRHDIVNRINSFRSRYGNLARILDDRNDEYEHLVNDAREFILGMYDDISGIMFPLLTDGTTIQPGMFYKHLIEKIIVLHDDGDAQKRLSHYFAEDGSMGLDYAGNAVVELLMDEDFKGYLIPERMEDVRMIIATTYLKSQHRQKVTENL